MTPASVHKVYIALGVIISLGWTSFAENDIQGRSKYKYGYVIAHEGGGSQAHLESRHGNLALGRYYVNLHNGTGQRVTYFADDLGFHTGVSYSSQNGKGSSKTEIAVGQKALDAFANSDVTQNTAAVSLNPTLLFGKKILKTALNTVTAKPGSYPQLNYTPVPGGFFLTHSPIEASNETTERPGYVSASPSVSKGEKYTGGVSQSSSNAQIFYPAVPSVSNDVTKIQIESTTPPVQTYTSLPPLFTPTQPPQQVRVSSFATGLNDLSYTKQKSIEMTNFAGIDAQLISEVQKHAEEIILKDLQRSQQANEVARFSSGVFQPSTVTLQPIVVTNDGETGINTVVPTTPIPEARKLGKDAQLDTINAVKITGKGSDQALEDSGHFRVSLSPSLSSSINVSQTPHQSINVDSTDRNSDSNNSTLCGFNLCEKDTDQIFSVDLSDTKPKKVTQDSLVTDVSDGLGTSKILRTFYPENKLHSERHYVTTIDVQKAISLDVNQNEAGSIHLAQNFPFDKIKPFDQVQNQNPPPQPHIPVQVSVTPAPLAPALSLSFLSTPQQHYIPNAVTAAPALVEVPNQNLAVLQGLNDLTSGQYGPALQDRVGTNRFEYENQLVVPPAPVDLTNPPANVQNSQEDIRQVVKSIDDLSDQIVSNIDAQHEEEQRKQNLVDLERKQYFQNLQKVEALKNQNTISYSVPIQTNVLQPTVQTPAETPSNVELIPQTQYVPSPQVTYDSEQQTQYEQPQQTHYETTGQVQYNPAPQTLVEPTPQTYQTEIKDFRHEIAVPQPNVQQISNIDIYQKPYNPPQIQTPQTSPRQYNIYDSQSVYAVDNSLQQSAPTQKIQLTNYAPAVAFQQAYAVTKAPEKPKQLNVLSGQLNAVGLATGVLPQIAKAPAAKSLVLNNVVPLDYSRLYQVQQPLSLLSYPVSLPAESKLVQGIYSPFAEQLTLPISVPQTYKLTYPGLTSVSSKQYLSTLGQRATNKLRVQPLKPSTPDDSGQREAVQNLLAQPQFHKTYFYPGFPINNNRLQLRHIRKNQISNSDQVHSQSIRRGKSLKNLRIEYGFKPPLRPSVEFSEEVKPSIYGSSVQPQ